MKHKVQFISLEEDDKDLIVAFAIDDAEMGIKSLILHRTLFFEEFIDEEERGVKVSLEDDYFVQEDFIVPAVLIDLEHRVRHDLEEREYKLDISKVQQSEIEDMVALLKKQNYDNRFTLHIT